MRHRSSISNLSRANQIVFVIFVATLVSAKAETAATAPTDQTFEPLVSIIDARPPTENRTAQLSVWITSCDNGIRRLGEEQEATPRLVLLGRDLSDALGNRIPHVTVTVNRYSVFLNAHKFEAGIAAATGGAMDHIAAEMLMPHDCTKVQTSGGWYSDSEVKTSHSPLIVEIDITLNGRSFNVRIVFSPADELEGHFGERIWSGGHYSAAAMSAYAQALHEANAALIDLLGKSLN